MSIARRLAVSMVMATMGMTGFCLSADAGVFNITAYQPDGTKIAASDLKIEYSYVDTAGATINTTTLPTTYPISITAVAHPANVAVTFTITRESTNKFVILTLNGRIATTTPVHVIIPAPASPAPEVPTSRAVPACPVHLPSPVCILSQPAVCCPAPVTYSFCSPISCYAIPSCQPAPFVAYSFCH